MKVRAQIAMVLNLDKCIGCHTCSVTCKNVWTNREGMEYAWFNNVETKPGIGYPKDWETKEYPKEIAQYPNRKAVFEAMSACQQLYVPACDFLVTELASGRYISGEIFDLKEEGICFHLPGFFRRVQLAKRCLIGFRYLARGPFPGLGGFMGGRQDPVRG